MKFTNKQRFAPIPVTMVHMVSRPDGNDCIYTCTLSNTTGPAIVNKQANTETWYLDGVIHRDGGPAIIKPIGSFWLQNGIYHRSDGPAIELANGQKDYYLDGVKVDPF